MVTELSPRWEWRNFPDRFDDIRSTLASAPDRVQESDEVYLLSTEGTDAVRESISAWPPAVSS